MSGPSGEHPRDLLSAYLDGEVTGAERAAVEAHLAGCPACREHLLSLRALASAVRDQPVPPVPEGLEERIGRRVDAATVVPFRRRFAVPATIAATIAAVGLVSLVLFEQRQAPPPATPPYAGPAVPRPEILQNENRLGESEDKDQKKTEDTRAPERQKQLESSRSDIPRSLAKEKAPTAPPPAARSTRDEFAPAPSQAPSQAVPGGIVGGVAGGVEGGAAQAPSAPSDNARRSDASGYVQDRPQPAEERARAAKSLAAAPMSVCGDAVTDAPVEGTWLVRDTDDATRRIAALALEHGGRLAPGKPDAPLTLVVEIPAAGYPSFVAGARAMEILGLDDVKAVETAGCVRQRILLRRVVVN